MKHVKNHSELSPPKFSELSATGYSSVQFSGQKNCNQTSPVPSSRMKKIDLIILSKDVHCEKIVFSMLIFFSFLWLIDEFKDVFVAIDQRILLFSPRCRQSTNFLIFFLYNQSTNFASRLFLVQCMHFAIYFPRPIDKIHNLFLVAEWCTL